MKWTVFIRFAYRGELSQRSLLVGYCQRVSVNFIARRSWECVNYSDILARYLADTDTLVQTGVRSRSECWRNTDAQKFTHTRTHATPSLKSLHWLKMSVLNIKFSLSPSNFSITLSLLICMTWSLSKLHVILDPLLVITCIIGGQLWWNFCFLAACR